MKVTISYIIRYHVRPPIAESRILSMGNDTITFWYDRHEDGNWRNRLRFYFNYDPLICKFCGNEMVLDSVTIKGKTLNLNTC